jgi:hypothetical protein
MSSILVALSVLSLTSILIYYRLKKREGYVYTDECIRKCKRPICNLPDEIINEEVDQCLEACRIYKRERDFVKNGCNTC